MNGGAARGGAGEKRPGPPVDFLTRPSTTSTITSDYFSSNSKECDLSKSLIDCCEISRQKINLFGAHHALLDNGNGYKGKQNKRNANRFVFSCLALILVASEPENNRRM